jgi:hypothetical protein
MNKKISISSPDAADPEQIAAERHVTEIMGPASWNEALAPPKNDTVPEEPSAPSVPVSASESAPLEAAPQPPTAEPPASEADLNLSEPPADFTAPKAEEQSAGEPAQEAAAGDASGTEPNDAAAPPIVMKESVFERFKEKFYRWWDNKVARYITLGVLAVIIAVVTFVPVVRTTVMNVLGFRASVSVYAVDATTLQPLKGASLSAGSSSVKTGEDGKAKLSGVKLGRQTVTVHKAGFADVKEQITFGFRAVDLGEIDMKATGLQLGFVLTDYLSGKPITDVTLESGESSTKSDKTGKAVITLDPDNTADAISIHKNGYRTEQTATDGEQGSVKQIKLVLAAKEVYVAKESGVYNLKKVDIDGKNDAVLLAGTGKETSALGVSVDPLSQYAAFVSTRDGTKDKDGYLLSGLTLVNIATGDSETIEHAEKLTLIGWSGTTLVYEQVVAGTSAANANREKLMAYNYATDKRYQIAGANHFLGAELHSSTLYYTVSSTDPGAKSGLMSAALDGSNKKVLQEADAWAVYRTDYKTLRLQASDTWYNYIFGGTASQTSATASVSRTYLDSGDAKLSAWADVSMTNGALSVYDIATGKDHEVTKVKGQYKPLRWLNNRVLVYREATKMGGADYVLNLDGGDTVKVADTFAF